MFPCSAAEAVRVVMRSESTRKRRTTFSGPVSQILADKTNVLSNIEGQQPSLEDMV